MSFPLPSRTLSGPRRRSLLVSATGAVVLVGCSGPESATDTTGGSPSAADRARARAARDSELLAERYTAVIAAHPALAERLRPLRAEVGRHAEAFGAGRRAAASASGAPSEAEAGATPGSPSEAGSGATLASTPGSAPAAVPAGQKGALADLAKAERALADRRTKTLVELPGELARLMASVAAAGAVHAYLLTKGGK